MKILVVLFFAIYFNVSAQSSFSTITNDNITIEYPSSWELLEVPEYSSLVKEKASSEEFQLLTTFGVEVDEKFKSLNSYTIHWKNKLQKNKNISSWQLISEEDIIFKAYQAKEFICTYKIGNFTAKTKVIILVYNKSIVNISSTSSLKDYQEKSEIVDLIYDSIVIK